MDRGDILYMVGAVLISIGAGIAYPPASLICFGSLLAFPSILSMFRSKGPTK